MSLPHVAPGDPHTEAHNDERDLLNNIQSVTDPDFVVALAPKIDERIEVSDIPGQIETVLSENPDVIAAAVAQAESGVGLAMMTETLVWQEGLGYPAKAHPESLAEYVGPQRMAAAPGCSWIQDKKGLFTAITSHADLKAYYPLNELSGSVARDVALSPAPGAISGAGTVFGPWNNPGGVNALGLRPDGNGVLTIPPTAKLDISDNFSFELMFRRRNQVLGTVMQKGSAFYGPPGRNMLENPNFELDFSSGSAVGNWAGIAGSLTGITRDTVEFFSGTSSAKVHVLASNASNGVVQVVNSVQPGRQTLSIRTKDDPSNPLGRHHIQVSYTPSTGGAVKYMQPDGSFSTVVNEVTVPRRNTWGEYTIDFDLEETTAGAGTGLTVSVKRDSLAGGGAAYDFWVDTASVRPALTKVEGTELFGNVGFETAKATSYVNGNWFSTGDATNCTIDTSVKRSGVSSGKVHILADGSGNGWIQVLSSATAGDYVIDTWTLDDPGHATSKHNVQIYYTDLSNVIHYWNGTAWQLGTTEIAATTRDTDWRQRRFIVPLPETTSAGVKGLTVSVKRAAGTGGGTAFDFWVDDVSVKKVTTGHTNGTFAVLSNRDGSFSLVAPTPSGVVRIANSTGTNDQLGWHSLVVTKAGGITKIFLDKLDVTVAGVNITIDALSGLATTLFNGDFGQFDAVVSHASFYGAAINSASVAEIFDEANMKPDCAPELMNPGLNSFSLMQEFDGRREKYAKALSSINVSVSRELISWYKIQPTDESTYDWKAMDELVDYLTMRNIEIRPSFDSPPVWAAGGTDLRKVPTDIPAYKGITVAEAGASYATWRDRWKTFIVAFVHRYKDRIHYYEILNEINSSIFWSPAASAELYVNFYNTVRAAILVEDPTAKVGVSGMARMRSESGTTDGNSYLSDEFVRAIIAKGIDHFDFLPGHPYTQADPRAHVRDDASMDLMHQIHDTLIELGRYDVNCPLNETGYYSGATRVIGSSVGQSLPQATIQVEGTILAVAGVIGETAWIPAAPSSVKILTSTGVQTVSYAAFTTTAGVTTLTGCTGGTGVMARNAPVSAAPDALTYDQHAKRVVDTISVVRDYFSAWCDSVMFFSARCYGGRSDPYNGASWYEDYDFTEPKSVALQFAAAALPYYIRRNSPPVVKKPTYPPRYEAVNGNWLRVAA